MNRLIMSFAGLLSASSLLLVDSAVKGTVLLAVAAVVALMLRRDSAATRHLVWLVAIVAMLAMPLLSAMLPQWRVLPAWMSSPRPAVADIGPSAIVKEPGRMIELPATTASEEVKQPSAKAFQPTAKPDSPPALEWPKDVPSQAAWSWNWTIAFPLVWAIGFVVLMLRLSAARWMIWNSQRMSTIIDRAVVTQLAVELQNDSAAVKDPIVMMMKSICVKLGISRPITLLIHPDKTIPLVFGIFQCRLMLPAAARQWSDEQLQSVLLHELAHIKRRDTIVQLLTQVACALHWFNPLAWFAAWRIDVERERSCDDLVLASGIRPSAYAGHLLDVVTGLSPSRWTQSCGLAMARKSSLEGRLSAVLGKDLNRRSVPMSLLGIALAVAVGIAVPVAMLRATEQNQTEGKAEGDPTMKVPRDSTAAVLLQRWQTLEERRTPLSEKRIARLRKQIDQWVNQPPVKPEASRVIALRNRNIDRVEHPVEDVIAWLDEIAAINIGPLQFAINGETRVGVVLSEERKVALKFGPVAANGLRAAWSRFPFQETYVEGDIVNSSLVLQNTTDEVIEFSCPYSLDSIVDWKLKVESGRKIVAITTWYTGSIPLLTWRLKPGEVAEIGGQMVSIGGGESRSRVHVPPSTVLHALRGEQVSVKWNVHKPVEMETGDVSFKVMGVEDVPVWSTSGVGKWNLPAGVTMEVNAELIHATDQQTTAVLTWPKDEAGDTARHSISLATDFFTNRDPWMLAWERDATVLWLMKGDAQSSQDFRRVSPTSKSIQRIDFSDPKKITQSQWSYMPASVPEPIRQELTKGFLPLANTPPSPLHAEAYSFTSRAEDVRPVSELLTGTWEGVSGDMKVRLDFPDGVTDTMECTMTFASKPGSAVIVDNLSIKETPRKSALRLIKTWSSVSGPMGAMLGQLKRGVGDTLLLHTMENDAFPGIENCHEFVLTREASPAATPPAASDLDLNSAKAPHTASSLGSFDLGDDVQLVIRQTTDVERIKFEKQGLPASFLGTIVFPGPEPEAARGPSPYEIILEEVFAFVWEPASKKLWVTDISEGQRIIIWMYLGGEDQTRPGAQKVMLREFDFSNPFDVKITHISTSENGGAWSWGKLLPQNFQAPVMQALGERGKRLLDFCETKGSEKPISKGTPQLPKLPDDRYVKSGVPLAEQNWPMSWGEEKERLSAGLRIIGDAHVDGEVTAELWVRNSDMKDLKFSRCLRADVGLRVIAKGKDGKEYSADITQFRGYPIFIHLLLPPGHIVKIKEFTVKIGSKKNDELERGWVSLDLAQGDYKLRAKWTDTISGAAREGEWTGNLTTDEVDLKIVEADALATPKPGVIPVRDAE